jgi:hypothetical protein
MRTSRLATPKKFVPMPIHLKQYEMVQALFHDQSSLNFETSQFYYVFSYMILLSASCLEKKILCDKQ